MNTPKIRFKGFKDDWEQRKFSDCYKMSSGYAFKMSDYCDEGVGLINGESIQHGIINDDNLNHLPEFFIQQYPEFLLKENDIVVGLNRPITNGNLKIARIPSKYNDSLLYQRAGKIVYKTDCDKDFTYVLLSQEILKHTLVEAVGSDQPFISTSKLDGWKMMMPSNMEEQVKIGEYFQNLDHLITLHQRKCDETKELKKFMLQKMFPKNGEKNPEIRFEGFTDDWEQRKLEDISQITAGGTPSTKELTYWEPKEVPWLASGEVHKKYIYDTDEMISEEGLNNSSAKWVEEGSVLIALAGQGKTRGTVAITRIPVTTNQSIAAIKFNDILDADYAFHNLDSRYDELRNISSGDGTRGGLNKQLLADLTIAFPQICEQREIGEYFTNLDHLITLHQRKCEKLKELKKFMLQNMFV